MLIWIEVVGVDKYKESSIVYWLNMRALKKEIRGIPLSVAPINCFELEQRVAPLCNAL